VQRDAREQLLEAVRRREIDVVLVWRLDRGAGLAHARHNGKPLGRPGFDYVSSRPASLRHR
jgi:DNA invertase Pin-like site-specific DNA recombinase